MQYTIETSKPVAQQAAESIRAMVLDGKVPDRGQINEVHLASMLKISRTPIREGLQQLVAEKLVEVKPRRGFFVRLLTPEEFSDLYDIRPLLDPKALLFGGQPTPEHISKIESANEAFLSAGSGLKAVMADEHFHRCLISNCSNVVMLDTINNLMIRTRRYEMALFRETAPVFAADNEHQQIISALKAKKLERAAEYLKQNLCSGKSTILNWLKQRSQE